MIPRLAEHIVRGLRHDTDTVTAKAAAASLLLSGPYNSTILPPDEQLGRKYEWVFLGNLDERTLLENCEDFSVGPIFYGHVWSCRCTDCMQRFGNRLAGYGFERGTLSSQVEVAAFALKQAVSWGTEEYLRAFPRYVPSPAKGWAELGPIVHREGPRPDEVRWHDLEAVPNHFSVWCDTEKDLWVFTRRPAGWEVRIAEDALWRRVSDPLAEHLVCTVEALRVMGELPEAPER